MDQSNYNNFKASLINDRHVSKNYLNDFSINIYSMIVGYSPYRLMKIFYYLFSIVDLLMFSLKIFIFPLSC